MQLSHFAFNIKCICFELKVFWPATSSAIDIEIELIGNISFQDIWGISSLCGTCCMGHDQALRRLAYLVNIIWRLVELTVEVSGHSSQKLIKLKNAWKRHLVANFQKSWKWNNLIFLLCPVSPKNILLWHESRKKLRCQFPPLDVNTVD